MTRHALSLACVILLASCSGPPEPYCGEGAEPVILTGLTGLLDGEPVVEVQLVVPESCEVVGESWMFWDEDTDTVTLGEEPTAGDLIGGGVETDPRLIFWRDLNLGVRLEYPDDEVADTLTLVWFSGTTDLVTVECARAGDALECALAP